MQHRYKIHEKVEMNKTAVSARGRQVYEVVRLMPADVSGEFCYRIKSGALERAVRESDIRRPAAGSDPLGDVFQR